MGTKSQSAIEISAILHTVHSFVGEKFWTNLWEKEEKGGKVVRGWDEIRESVLEVCQRHIWEIFVPFLLLRHHLLIISSAVKVSSFVTALFFSDARMGAVSLDERHRARIERMMMEEEEAKELEVEVFIIHLWFLTLSACRPIWPQQVTGAQWRAQCTVHAYHQLPYPSSFGFIFVIIYQYLSSFVIAQPHPYQWCSSHLKKNVNFNDSFVNMISHFFHLRSLVQERVEPALAILLRTKNNR